MNKEEVIRLAKEAGLLDNGRQLGATADRVVVERFADLVAAAEREACAKIIEAYRVPVGNSPAGELAADWTMDALGELRDEIRARLKS